MIADVPAEKNRDFLPYVYNDLSAKSVGDPDAVLLLSIPTADEFVRIESLALHRLEEPGVGFRILKFVHKELDCCQFIHRM